jgi:nucleotide-binding universal stress UspA family protein
MYDDLLFPTDGSENASIALEHAMSLAERYGATVHVLYVVNTNYSDIGATGDTTIGTLRERGEEVVREAEDRASTAGVDVVTRIEEGDPYRTILEYADENADLIVMGTRGRSGLDRYLLGSGRKPDGFRAKQNACVLLTSPRRSCGRPTSPSSPSVAATDRRHGPRAAERFSSITPPSSSGAVPARRPRDQSNSSSFTRSFRFVPCECTHHDLLAR